MEESRRDTATEHRTSHQQPAWFLRNQGFWTPDAQPPLLHNRFEALVDGRDAMLSMYRAMLGARKSIDLLAWFFTPSFEVVRGADQRLVPPASDGSYSIESMLADRARDGIAVRVLLWKGALIGKMQVSLVRDVRRRLSRHPGLACAIDRTSGLSHTHHQKALLVDGQIGFAGGLDFTNRDADRWDTSEHARRKGRNWHDVHCRFEGPAAQTLERFVRERWFEVTKQSLLTDGATIAFHDDGLPLQVLRTVPRHAHSYAPRGDFSIDSAYIRALLGAKRFIYIENQYLWSPSITSALLDTIAQRGANGLRVLLLLPDQPNVGRPDTDRNVRRLLDADRGRGIVRICTLGKPPGAQSRTPSIYVHAKVCIVDDAWFTIGSANLNGRGLATDTELNVASVDQEAATRLRLRLWGEHLCISEDKLGVVDPCEAIDRWWPKPDGTPHGRVLAYEPHSGLLDVQLGLPEAVFLDL